MHIVVTGATGQVGTELAGYPWPSGARVDLFRRSDLDITDRVQVDRALQPPLDVVINAAAYAAVDLAESDPTGAFAANVRGPAILADRCAKVGAMLIHISTDYVFDGEKHTPYTETDLVRPLSVYGRSKADGEEAVRQRLPRHLIVRTASVFSRHGPNFIRTMIRLGYERPVIRVINDQTCCPTAARDIAHALAGMAAVVLASPVGDRWGSYHFCGRPWATWYEFARHIFAVASSMGGPSPDVQPISSTEFASPVHRPSYSVLDCTKIAAAFGLQQPDWRPTVHELVQQEIKKRYRL